MPFFQDFTFFWNAANALLQGQDPYLVEGVYYPLPSLVIFIPLALLPLEISRLIWVTISLVIFVLVLRRQALLWIFFVPTIQAFGSAQYTPLLLGLLPLLAAKRYIGLGLALLSLKPHLIVGAIPFLWIARVISTDDLRRAAGIYTLLALPTFLIMPDWPIRWIVSALHAHSPAVSPTLWGVFAFLATPLQLLAGVTSILLLLGIAWRMKGHIGTGIVASLLINPIIIPYDLVLLVPYIRDSKYVVTLAIISYPLWWISLNHQNPVFFFVLTLLALIFTRAPFTPPTPTARIARSSTIATETRDTRSRD